MPQSSARCAAVPASQLRHWAVAPPPAPAPGGRPFRQFAAAFYPPTYTDELDKAVLSVDCRTASDGTLVRQISQGDRLCVEEQWASDGTPLELAAPRMAEIRLMVRKDRLFQSAGEARAAAGLTAEPGTAAGWFPLVAVGLAEWVRARDTRPMAGLRVCLPGGQADAGAADDAASLTIRAWKLSWGAVEFELVKNGVVIGQAVASLSCGPRRQHARVNAGTSE